MGAAEYREWAPASPLRRHVRCTWAGRLADDGTPYVDSVLPDGCIDLVWDGVGVFVAGPDTGPVPLTRHAGSFFVGLRFRPGLAPTVLGVAASELRDLRVDGREVLGGRVGPLVERLHAAPSLRAAAREFERALQSWLAHAAAPDPLVEAVVGVLDGPAMRPVASIARQLGVSERQLHRRCTASVGYGPKVLDRVLRFRRFLALIEQRREPSLARLAVEAGYADQAHLTRETKRLGGRTPAVLVAARP